MSARFVPLFAAACVLFSGCALQSPEELERLVKEDPTFKQMIGQRDQAHAQIALIKQDLLTRKKTVDAQAEKLRAEYEANARVLNQKIEQLRAAIESHRQILKRDIDAASAQVEAKQTELAGYQ
jgi:hypothetical protein